MLEGMDSSSKEPAKTLNGGSILIIDDDFVIREALLSKVQTEMALPSVVIHPGLGYSSSEMERIKV